MIEFRLALDVFFSFTIANKSILSLYRLIYTTNNKYIYDNSQYYPFPYLSCYQIMLSLYSTATQNTWRRGLALGNAPDAKGLRWKYQHVGIFWRYLMLKFAAPPPPDAKPKICVIPDANPRRQSVEYRLRWVPTQNAGDGHVHFMFFV